MDVIDDVLVYFGRDLGIAAFATLRSRAKLFMEPSSEEPLTGLPVSIDAFDYRSGKFLGTTARLRRIRVEEPSLDLVERDFLKPHDANQGKVRVAPCRTMDVPICYSIKLLAAVAPQSNASSTEEASEEQEFEPRDRNNCLLLRSELQVGETTPSNGRGHERNESKANQEEPGSWANNAIAQSPSIVPEILDEPHPVDDTESIRFATRRAA
ncbi:MAG: hypothetical protein AAGG01_20320 [Planctomycetota bacterium]